MDSMFGNTHFDFTEASKITKAYILHYSWFRQEVGFVGRQLLAAEGSQPSFHKRSVPLYQFTSATSFGVTLSLKSAPHSKTPRRHQICALVVLLSGQDRMVWTRGR